MIAYLLIVLLIIVSNVYNNYCMYSWVNKMDIKQFGFLLTDITRLMRREYQKKASKMTPMQGRALVYVARNEGIRQVALAELLEIQPITLARLIDFLAEEDLVERRVDPTDRRAYCLYLKEKAGDVLEQIDDIVCKVREKALKGLSEDQVQNLIHSLENVHTNLSGESVSKPTK